MSWFRVDDKSAFHRKVLKAGNEAWGAICRAGAVSSGEGTDGRVSLETMLAIAPMRVWEKGIKAGLVERIDAESYQLHDYLQWNESAAEIEAKAAARRKKSEQAAQARWGARGRIRSEQPPSMPEALPDNQHGNAPSMPVALPQADTSRCPDPIRSGSDPRSISDPISLPPLTGRGAREAAAAAEHDPVTSAVIVQLGQTSKLRHLATAEFAARIAPHCDQHPALGKHTLAEILESIREADSKILDQEAGGEVFDQGRISALVIGFVKRGRRPVPARTAPPSRVQPGEGRAWTSNPKEV